MSWAATWLRGERVLGNSLTKAAAFEDFLKLREKMDELGCDRAKG